MKVELKERTEHHVRTYFEKVQDAQIQAMLPQSAATVEQALENYRKTLLPNTTSYGRTICVDGVYAGDIWCYCIDHDEEPNAMLSYCLFEKNLWGKGITTEALRQFLADVVPRFGLRSVGAFTYSANAPSIRVLLKNDFAEVEAFMEDGVLSKYLQKNTEDML